MPVCIFNIYCKNNLVIIHDLTYELKSLNGKIYTCGLWDNGIKAEFILLKHSTEEVLA